MLITAGWLAGIPGSSHGARASTPAPANFVAIMTDDQTVRDLGGMPITRRLIGGHGVRFSRFYVSFPLCCPSRATFLTGRYSHNHGVEGNRSPRGGYYALDKHNTLPVWLRAAGYRTTYIGKFLNEYGRRNPREVPPGWTDWRGLVDTASGLTYWGYTLNENGTLHTYGKADQPKPGTYETDVFRRKTVKAIQTSSQGSAPFFVMVGFFAPHVEEYPSPDGVAEPRPAPRDLDKLANKPLPHPPNFNERDMSDKPRFIRKLRTLSQHEIDKVRIRWERRRESLLAVDDAVRAIVRTLRNEGQLDNTYVVFTSDNGFFNGEHRFGSGKLLPYEESARQPLLIRGPGIPAGRVSRELVANVDLAPTITEIAGATASKRMDGRSLLPYAEAPGKRSLRPILLEAGNHPPGTGAGSSGAGTSAAAKDAYTDYRAIRFGRYLWVQYGDGERELYDLKADPFELASKHRSARYRQVRALLHSELGPLGRCAGASCRLPRQRPPAPR